MNPTAASLFQNISTVVSDGRLAPSTRNKLLHETLVVTCAEGLKATRYGFGDLNSQTESLITLLHIPADEAFALRKARRDSNHSAPLSRDALLHDAAALARLISRVFKASVPDGLTALLPRDTAGQQGEALRVNSPDKRCIVKAFDEHTITVVVDEDGERGERTVRYTEANQYARMEYLHAILRTGMHLNLLGCQTDGDTITPRLIIVEPDCLMDISVIASCFEEYGHHPLLYLVSRMKPKANTQPIILGNYAGACLDDIINDSHFSAAKTLIRNFRDKALEYATCKDFDARQFKDDAARQAANLVDIVGELRQHYDMSKAILEPTFVCEKLGLQGRVDLMTTDMRLLVEQKAGRNTNIERNTKNAHGARVVEKHYVQVLLYYGILYYNFGVRRPDIRLLYSKYALPDGLLSVTPLMQLIYEALRFRNEAIALEFDIAANGMEHILPQLTERNLNVAHASGFFYDNFLRPPLVALLSPLQRLSPLEKSYFCRMMQFAIRENILSRVGVVEGTGNCMANLWNMPLVEKIETGNIYVGLNVQITPNTPPRPSPEVEPHPIPPQRGGGLVAESNDKIVFTFSSNTTPVSMQAPSPTGEGWGEGATLPSGEGRGGVSSPNFRKGDMVYVYSYPKGGEPDVRKAILFKGGIEEIHTDRIVVRLADRQQNKDIFKPRPDRCWAIEHAGSDVGGSAAIRSLYSFITAGQDFKDLLLGQRVPQADKSLALSRSYNPTLDPLLLKAKQARDFFLLVGPPGTGKTSMALQYIVREALHPTPGVGSLLLMAYTNRAVDEICAMLCDNGIDFVRIGSELSCAESYVPYLLQNKVGDKPTLAGMRRLLTDARVVVGTTSMMQSRSYLFTFKSFGLVVIDEASQILEPGLVGLLASIRSSASHGNGGVAKFILIGDYKQLPAVVQQSDADSTVSDPLLLAIGLTNCKSSLFERLIRQELRAGRNDFIGVLRRQGRMHPEIAEFPNRAFYFAEQPAPVPLPHQQAGSLGYTLPSQDHTDDLLKTHRLLFLASKDCRQPELSDKVNAEEARIVADMLRRIRRFYGADFNVDKTVGVIVPYRNQIAMIRQAIEATGLRDLEGVSIDTVERYQGSQRDVIIYSFTIQQGYQLDFLTANTFEEDGHDIDRKLNVVLTRARKQLILTGNAATLAGNNLFRALIDFVRDKGGYAEM